ncbi:hypothetical protein WJX81_002768 [Elliptochloris bilobata]|uniref:peptidylprolyl isomerase n=1 Tax=Elliptochloris bilobata TaxID=381761 RepID=A0AAW1RAV0_9CHLO
MQFVPSNCSRTAKVGDTATVHYTGTLTNGTQFDSSRGRAPFAFQVGGHSVIPGVDYGVIGMCAGENRTLTMVPELGYGAKGAPPTVPPNSTLKFDVEMISLAGPVAPAPNPLAPLAPIVTTFLQQGLQQILNGKK